LRNPSQQSHTLAVLGSLHHWYKRLQFNITWNWQCVFS
jgi:hypothetical protein